MRRQDSAGGRGSAIGKAGPWAITSVDGGEARLAILLTDLVRRTCLSLASLAALLVGAYAVAGPLDDPHAADTGFSGPTSGDLASVYWNPAGLGLLQGPQVMLGGAWQSTSVSVERGAINPATGAPTGAIPNATTFSRASGHGSLHPFRFPPGPGGFFAIGAGIGHRFGIALALYSPFSSRLTMQPSSDGELPTRYHLVSMRLDHYALATGLAIHASDSIQIGVVPGLLFPSGQLALHEDARPDSTASAENPANDVAYALTSRGTQMFSYFLSFGALYRRGRFSLGLAYTTAPLGTGGLVTLPMDDTKITPQGGQPGDLCPADNQGCLAGQIRYRLPSIYTLAATWKTRGPWSFTGIARWLRYGAHDEISVLVAGPPAQTALGTSIPDHLVLYRGFQDSFDLRGRIVYEAKHFRAGGTLRVETTAVPASHVTAAAIDGLKLGPQLAFEMRVWRQVRMSASYSFTYMFPVDTGASVFDPRAASACADAGGDLGNPACQARRRGQARPTATGTYHLWRQALSVYTSVGF